MRTNYQAAEAIGNNRRFLRQRLNAARSVLVDRLRAGFGAGHLDFERKRLTGRNGVILQWRNTGETNRGSVSACRENIS